MYLKEVIRIVLQHRYNELNFKCLSQRVDWSISHKLEFLIKNPHDSNYSEQHSQPTQLAFTCIQSTKETLEKYLKYVQS